MTDLFTRALVSTKFLSRRIELFNDGYNLLFEHTDEFGMFSKLKHHNGNIIILTCDYGTGTITQKTNGKVVHTETMCQP